MPLTFHRLVQKDVDEIMNYYIRVPGEKLADKFFEELKSKLDQIESNPAGFHFISED